MPLTIPDAYLAQYDGFGDDWISTSGLALMDMCGIAYQKRYEERIPEPRGVRATIGCGAHKGRERNLAQKVKSQQDLSVDQVTDAARDSVNEDWEAYEIMKVDSEFDGKSDKDARGLAVDIAVDLTDADYDAFQKGIMPEAVELCLRASFPGFEKDVVGKLDCRDVDGLVVDLKTGKRSKNQDFADNCMGITTYGMLSYAAEGEMPKGYKLHSVAALKKGIKCLEFETTRDKRQMNQMIARFAAALDAIRKGVFLPCNPEHWKCGPAYCGYWPTCKFGGGK